MVKDVVFHLRLDSELRDEIDDRAADQGISSADFIREAIESYLAMDGEDIPSIEEIQDMEWDELVDLVDDLELETEPKDIWDGGLFSDIPEKNSEETMNLKEAIIEELGLSIEDDDDLDDSDQDNEE